METKWGKVSFHYSNRNKPFRCNYKGYRLPIGMFCEWISCEIINNLIDDALDEECDI